MVQIVAEKSGDSSVMFLFSGHCFTLLTWSLAHPESMGAADSVFYLFNLHPETDVEEHVFILF